MRRMEPDLKTRVWGVRDLRPWIDRSALAEPIGEAWYRSPGLPLLKWIMTSEKLSVQVHPDDDYARRHHDSPGKTECWYVVATEPGASLGLGFKERLTLAQAREAALDGSLEKLIDWRPVTPGDFVLVSARTVHAIGAGLTLVEIQQDSDITFRLYDYGRGRDVHLERGLEVADLAPWTGSVTRGVGVLAECPYFRVERHEGAGTVEGPCWIVDLTGPVWLVDPNEVVRFDAADWLFAR